jgi:hypothetical protein
MYGFSQQNTTGGIYGRLEEHSVHLVGRRHINSRIAGKTNQVLLHYDGNVKTDLPTVHEMRETTSLPDQQAGP